MTHGLGQAPLLLFLLLLPAARLLGGEPAGGEPRERLAAAPAAAGTAGAENRYQEAIRRAEGAAREPENPGGSAPGGWSFSDWLGLAALLAALALMAWAIRWSRGTFFRGIQGGEMRLLDRLAVGRNSTLLVIRARGRDYWLADHARGVTLLAEWPAADPADKPPRPS